MLIYSMIINNSDKILFQGDSITDMRRSRGINVSHNLGHGYVYIIASYLALHHYDKKLSFLNRGIAQDKIEEIAKRWKDDTLDLEPNILSILAGINNIVSIVNNKATTSLVDFSNIYTKLLSDFKIKSPDSKIIICEPFALPVDKRIQDWTKRKQTLNETHDILKNIAKQFDAQYIQLQSVFEQASKIQPYQYWLYDGTHPSPAGHALIAQTWLKEVMDIKF